MKYIKLLPLIVFAVIMFGCASSDAGVGGLWYGQLTPTNPHAQPVSVILTLKLNDGVVSGEVNLKEIDAVMPINGNYVGTKLTFKAESSKGYGMTYSGDLKKNKFLGDAVLFMKGMEQHGGSAQGKRLTLILERKK